MKINKSELQEALEKVKPGLATKELIEQSTSFAFLGDRVVTYNDEISISYPVSGLKNMQGAIKAKALYEFLARTKSDEIHVSQEENQIIITAGQSKAGLLFEQEIHMPIEEVGEIGKWKKLPKDFLDALKLCYPCCSSDMTRPVLTCLHINGNKVEASDSYQIIQYELKKKTPGKAFLIPATTARELCKYDVKEIALGDGWAHFRADDGTQFSCRTVEGAFPGVQKFLDDIKGIEFTFPENTLDALNRAAVFAKKELEKGIPTVTVKADKGEMILSSRNEYGWFEEKLKVKGKKDKKACFTFTIGIEFLASLFSRLKTCTISQDRIGFGGEGWRHVIAIIEGEK